LANDSSASPSTNPSSSPSTNPNPSRSPANVTVSPSPTPKLKCVNYTGCNNCTAQFECIWCETDKKCVPGGFWGPNDNPFNGCADWRWEQCNVNGKAVLWVSVAILGAVLLIFLFVCFCLCCYCRSRQRTRDIIKSQQTWAEARESDEMERLMASHPSRTEIRRQQLREKYGRPFERKPPSSNLLS